jgi:positive regulator of sigma E activity
MHVIAPIAPSGVSGGRRLIEQGVVRAVNGAVVRIEVLPAEPESCKSCGSCADGPTGRILEIENRSDLRVGQRLDLEVKGVGDFGPAVAVFLLPVTAILLGGVLGSQLVVWFPGLGLSSTTSGVIGAVTLLIAAVLGIRLYDRAFARRRPKVRVLRIRD